MYTLWVISGLRVLFVFKHGPSQTLRFSSRVYCVCMHNREKFYSMVPSLVVSWSLVACSLCAYELSVNFFFLENFLRAPSYLKQRLYMCKYGALF